MPRTPRATFIVATLCLVLTPGDARAQASCAETTDPWAFLRDCSEGLVPAHPGSVGEALHGALHNLKSPNTLNSALGELELLTGGKNLLGPLHIHFKSLSTGSDHKGLGLAYDWTKNLSRTPHQQGQTHFGYSAELEAAGTLAASAEENPDDFLETTLHTHMYFQAGGAIDPGVLQDHLSALTDSIEVYETRPFGAPVEMSDLMEAVWDSLSTQLYVTAGPEFKFETNQAFDHHQFVVGARIGVDLKAWNPNSTAAKLNVVDYPAALLRFLTGTDASFQPSGVSYPTLLMTLQRVNPNEHPSRAAVLGDIDPHSRFALTMEYRSKLMDSRQGPVWVHASFRHHSEIDPPDAVVGAGLHTFNRFFVAIEGPGGMTASWATGHPSPLEADKADTWGVGFKFHIN